MRCPYGVCARGSWRCYTAYSIDWVIDREWLPWRVTTAVLFPMLMWLETRG